MTLRRVRRVWVVTHNNVVVCGAGMRLTKQQAHNKVENERRFGNVAVARPATREEVDRAGGSTDGGGDAQLLDK